MSLIKGQLTISRVSSSSGDGYIEIRFRDVDACAEFARFRVSFADFAQAVTGLGYAPGEIQVQGLEVVGLKSENKSELVPGSHPYGDKTKLRELQAAMKKFQVDGWIGRASDLENHYNYKPGGCQVAFFRHIPKETA